jgi:hypothetical protein
MLAAHLYRYHIVDEFYATGFLGEGGNGAVFAGTLVNHGPDVSAGTVHQEAELMSIDETQEVAIKCSTDLETLEVRAGTSGVPSYQIRFA